MMSVSDTFNPGIPKFSTENTNGNFTFFRQLVTILTTFIGKFPLSYEA